LRQIRDGLEQPISAQQFTLVGSALGRVEQALTRD
jgi:hypothetical protein